MRRFRRRLHRLGRLVILGLMALWFAVIAPGHQRGVIRLPGSAAPPMATCDAGDGAVFEPGTPSCCRTRTTGRVAARDGGAADERQQDSTPPRRDPSRGCAICQLLATLDAPLVLIWPDALRLQLLASAVVLADQIQSVFAVRHRPIRAPPTSVAC